MFFIFNKQKIYSYLIAASTVVILFVLSFFLINTDIETVQTTSKPNNTSSTYNNHIEINENQTLNITRE